MRSLDPDSHVDITDKWDRALEWWGRLLALVRGKVNGPENRDGAPQAIEALPRYCGQASRVKYAEALTAADAAPRDLFERQSDPHRR